MSQNFRLRFDQMREGNPTAAANPPATDSTGEANDANADGTFASGLENDVHNKIAESADAAQYGTPGHLRNVCFGWPDCKRLFLSYNYLVSGEFASGEDGQTITLVFTSHTVVVQGFGLDEMYYALMEQSQRMVLASDSRYENMVDDTENPSVVVEQIIVKNNT